MKCSVLYTLEDLNPDAFKRPIYLFKGNVTNSPFGAIQ